MELLLNAKKDEDIKYIIDKANEILGIKKVDLLNLDMLVAITLDFIKELEEEEE